LQINLTINILNKFSSPLNYLNLMENDKPDQLNNFRKANFKFKDVEYELGISLYSQLIFIIVTENSKLGNMYIGEIENEDFIEEDSEFFDVKCILGDRNNEESQFLANFVINYLFRSLKNSNNSKIQKILVSSTLKRGSFTDDNGLTGEFKNFISVLKENLIVLLNI
jgi:hypothetical protein